MLEKSKNEAASQLTTMPGIPPNKKNRRKSIDSDFDTVHNDQTAGARTFAQLSAVFFSLRPLTDAPATNWSTFEFDGTSS